MRAPVQATTADGVLLRGEVLRGPTTTWIVLIHDVGEDLDAWRGLVAALDHTGWNLLALDLRGHGGSEGEWHAASGPLDVDLGVNLARRSGAEHVAIAASGAGAVAALQCVARAVDEPSVALADSLVLLSPGPLEGVDRDQLRGDGLATLVISGALGSQAVDADAILRASIGWTVSVTFATESRGTDLLDGPFAGHIADKLGSFLREQAAMVGPGLARLRTP